ncbi:hypothetical protein H6F92_22565 [Microcystis wesenbergii FACHB-1317]|uniref:hypothetical protein n=1 Tax=Microcystis TaxID=1125 RepID=UPI0016814F2B|nr:MULTISPECIES: hypothetical protein [Microcystis]MBD2291407.1 hypothetical protein [Microcystis wesenbergii FACHB-1317]UZO75072.1 hypothetical protein M8120_19795 [Microcystis aeruginosa str. Chao 1910]
MLKNLFGGKKSDFYLELKETDGEQEATATTAAAAPVVEAPAPVAEKKAKKTSVKKEKQVKETPAAPVSAPAPLAATNGKVEPQEVEFATKYLITPSLSRRRPGPSLNGFKDMARKAKLPANRG